MRIKQNNAIRKITYYQTSITMERGKRKNAEKSDVPDEIRAQQVPDAAQTAVQSADQPAMIPGA